MSSFEKLEEAIEKLARAVAALPIDLRYAPAKPRALVVGGFVRDRLFHVRSKDADVEVYGVSPEVLERLIYDLFGEVNIVGASFGVMKVPLGDGYDLDVSLPRRESKQGFGHRGFLIHVDPALPIIEAARRRDFTMNAIALDPLTQEFIDPYHGGEDVRLGVLRVVDQGTFTEDPLRILRAMQFVARFPVTPDQASHLLMRQMVERGDLNELATERITCEIEKLLLAPHPSRGLCLARELGVVEVLWPELAATIGVLQEPEWHPEGDVWTHTLMVVDEAADILRRQSFDDTRMCLQIMLGALCHDFGKPRVTQVIDGRIRARGHEEAGEDPTRAFCARFTFHHDVVAAAVVGATEHLKVGQFFRSLEKGELHQDQYVRAVSRLMKRIAPVPWQVLAAVSEADMRGRGLPSLRAKDKDFAARPSMFFAETIHRYLLEEYAFTPLLLGRDLLALGCAPGPRMGEILRAVEAARDDGLIATREAAQDFARRCILEGI